MFQFFDETAFLNEWCKTRTISQLTGFETHFKDGTGRSFNYILSNGNRSTQRDDFKPTNFPHMIPADALNTITSVIINHDNARIVGFSFFDKDGALLFKIGATVWSG